MAWLGLAWLGFGFGFGSAGNFLDLIIKVISWSPVEDRSNVEFMLVRTKNPCGLERNLAVRVSSALAAYLDCAQREIAQIKELLDRIVPELNINGEVHLSGWLSERLE